MRIIRALFRAILLSFGVIIIAGIAAALFLNARLPSIEPSLPLSMAELTETYGEPVVSSSTGLQRWQADITVAGFVVAEKAISVMTETGEDEGQAEVVTIFNPIWTGLEVFYLNGVGEQRHRWGALCFFNGFWPSRCESWG
jgi:hypothetical protein